MNISCQFFKSKLFKAFVRYRGNNICPRTNERTVMRRTDSPNTMPFADLCRGGECMKIKIIGNIHSVKFNIRNKADLFQRSCNTCRTTVIRFVRRYWRLYINLSRLDRFERSLLKTRQPCCIYSAWSVFETIVML